MNNTCLSAIPGQPLSPWQKVGLNLVANLPRLEKGRDVVFAIDLTPSVNANQEGKLHLKQIVEDSLRAGDSVYIVPFASNVEMKPLTSEGAIHFEGKKEDVKKVLQGTPLQSNPNLKNADIQRAELFVYKNLAQLNYCRLSKNVPIRSQSVIWITDAPVLTEPGITSKTWIETPENSPFRQVNSDESKLRWQWIQRLEPNKREREIPTVQNQVYKLIVVDISPTVPEICSPVPGGGESCDVTPYLIRQLWLPTLVVLIGFLLGAIALKKCLSNQKKWKLEVKFNDDKYEAKTCYLRNKHKISIGEEGANAIDCPGSEIRAYLERKGEKVYLKPTQEAPIFYNGDEVTKKILLSKSSVRLNCPDEKNRDFEFVINIKK